MIGQQPRMVPPAEARRLALFATEGPWAHRTDTDQDGDVISLVGSRSTWQAVADTRGLRPDDCALIAAAPDLAHTAAVLGDQRATVLALHRTEIYTFLNGKTRVQCCTCTNDEGLMEEWPCRTARALGVDA